MSAPAASPAEALRLRHGCTLRPMLAEHLEDYKALRDAMLAGHEDAFTSDAATERARDAASYASRLSGGTHGATLFTLLAWLEGRAVGALTVEREPRAKVAHTAHLVGMMVADAQQGRGIGRALMEAALRQLDAEPSIELLTLSVTASNQGARRLYEAMGFERYGTLRRAIKMPDGRYLDKDLMSLDLRPRRDGPHT